MAKKKSPATIQPVSGVALTADKAAAVLLAKEQAIQSNKDIPTQLASVLSKSLGIQIAAGNISDLEFDQYLGQANDLNATIIDTANHKIARELYNVAKVKVAAQTVLVPTGMVDVSFTLNGTGWTLTGASLDDTTLTLTFSSATVVAMRQLSGPVSYSVKTVTAADGSNPSGTGSGKAGAGGTPNGPINTVEGLLAFGSGYNVTAVTGVNPPDGGTDDNICTVNYAWAPTNGDKVACWIVPIIEWCAQNGWSGTLTAGYPPSHTGHTAGSNHYKAVYPGGAVDVGDGFAVTQGQALLAVLKNYPGSPTLKWGGTYISGYNGWNGHDAGHFSGSGT